MMGDGVWKIHCIQIHLIASQCNGLITVAAKVGQNFLCNPVTKEFFVLPTGYSSPYDLLHEEVVVLGFDLCTATGFTLTF
uniref:Uncharacterized protein n=1 Tax=Oryza nivara TaxID=4536 RepID=A0A0E0GZU2_ORYNI